MSSASSDSVRRELRRHKAAKAAAEKLNKQNKSNEPDNVINLEAIDQPQNNSKLIKNRANDEVSFLPSGKLLEDTNTVNGIVVRYIYIVI